MNKQRKRIDNTNSLVVGIDIEENERILSSLLIPEFSKVNLIIKTFQRGLIPITTSDMQRLLESVIPVNEHQVTCFYSLLRKYVSIDPRIIKRFIYFSNSVFECSHHLLFTFGIVIYNIHDN